MTTARTRLLLTGMTLALCAGIQAPSQTLIIADSYDVPSNGTGFALDAGVNAGINLSTTRLTGSVASGLRYYKYSGAKADNLHSIGTNNFYIARGADSSTITLGPGVGAFDFSSALRSVNATPGLPSVYEIRIKMASVTSPGNQRISFALSSDLGGAGAWDFGIQLTRTAGTNDYLVQRRIDTASSGGAADLDTTITNLPFGTYGSELSFLIKVTDAGTETSAYNSRVQVSMDNGTTWVYDTAADPELPSGWRLDTAGRYILWDCAGFGRGTYDDFSVTWISGPDASVTQVWTGGGADANWSSGANWQSGQAPVPGDRLVFEGVTRATNFNNLDALTVPWVTFNNGGFDLTGNLLTISGAITNLSGNNTLSLSSAWASSSAKSWMIASGSELTLGGATAVDVAGNHTLRGGGTLRLVNAFTVGGLSTANPAVEIGDGRIVLDGASASFTSRGGFRLGVSTTASVAEIVLTNGANFYLNLAGGGFRVGDSANGIVNRLRIDNSTLTMSGGDMGVPWAAGATAEVLQVGGVVSGCDLNFNHGGAGTGTYTIINGTLEPRQIARNTAGGSCAIYFDNAILRTYLTANNPFFAGLDVAEIQAGGLNLDVTSADIVVEQSLSGVGGLTKNGPYAAVLTGTNTYAGNTLVQAGQLTLPTVQTNSAGIVIADGAGLGVLATVADATLTAGSLGFNGSSSAITFDLGDQSNPTVPLVQVANLTASGTVAVNFKAGIKLTPGRIKLIDYSGTIGGGGFASFAKGTLPPGVSGDLDHNIAESSIDLVITAVPGFRWTGAVNSDWDIAATANWISSQDGLPSTYSDGFETVFWDGAASANVNLAVTVSPATLAVSNNLQAYVFSGAGGLITGMLVKEGTNSLTRVETVSDQIARLELNAGTFVANDTVDTAFNTILSDTSPGLGTFVKQGSSTFTVNSNSSTFDGAILIQQGVFKVGTSGALGSTNGATTISSGATLDVNDIQSPHEPVIVSGAGFNGQGAITELSGVGGVQHNLTDVTLVGDTTFGCATGGRWDIRVRSGSSVGPGLRGNGFNLTKVGPGTVSIACQRHNYGAGVPVPYWDMNLGEVVIAEGGLTFAESLTPGNPTQVIRVASGASLGTFDLGITNPISRTILITNAAITGGGGTTGTNAFNGTIQTEGVISLRPADAALVFDGPIVGSGALMVGGNEGGRVLLNGANTYTGDTTVTNSILGGAGAVGGSLIMQQGTLSPGMGVGVLTVIGNATLAGTTQMELAPGQSPNSDQLSVGGVLNFGGQLVVVLAAGAATPGPGDVYTLFNKGGNGAFATITLPPLGEGLSWETNNLAINGTISVSGLPPQPAIETISATDGNLIFSGSGGVAGATYRILSSTNVAAPLLEWLPVATNVFEAGGAFNVTNTINPAVPETYFRVVVP